MALSLSNTQSDLQEAMTFVSLATPPANEDATVSHIVQSKGGGEQPSLNARFRIIRPHAEGGLGKVSVAMDRELNREVALKEIKEGFAYDESARTRFTLEAEITGGLEHPGIVPVYGLGHRDDGRPFYAMRFIKGDSLKDACAKYHDHKDERSASDNALEFRKILGRFIDVCNAIEYAHSRGVLHRDLEPGNIMLGKYGETLVVDWGLAKAIGRDEPYKDLEEPTLQPSAADSTPATQMGSALGTPHFMSPEQAAGKLDELGPASDVYSLGVTLYYLLVNRSPFTDRNLDIVLARVQTGEFETPREVDPSVPKPLEAICRKTMAVMPSDRYTSPCELAEDVGRWLADEPVLAGRESVGVRSRRWMRKHPQTVGSLAASLVLGLVASIVVSMVLSNSNRSLTRAQQTELSLRKKAESAVESAAERGYANLIRLAQIQWANGQTQLAKETLSQCDWSLRGWEHDFLYTKFHPPHIGLVCESEDVFPPQEFSAWSRGSTNGFRTSDYSPDGKLIAAAGRNFHCSVKSNEGDQSFSANPVVIWNRRTRKIEHLFREHHAFVTKVAFSNQGRYLASSDQDGNLIIWDLELGAATKRLNGHNDSINSLIFTASDQQLIVCDSKTIKWWDLETGDCVRDSKRRYTSIALSPDERQIAGGALPGIVNGRRVFAIEILDIQTDTISKKLLGHDQQISSISFHKDGKLVFTAAGANGNWWSPETTDAGPPILIPTSREVAVWNVEAEERVGRFQFHDDQIKAMALSPGGFLLATGSEDQTVRLWDVGSERLIQVLPVAEAVESLSFSPDGTEVLVNTSIWKTTDSRRIVLADRRGRDFGGLIVENGYVITRVGDEVVAWKQLGHTAIDPFSGLIEPTEGVIVKNTGYSAFDYSAKANLVALGCPAGSVYSLDKNTPSRDAPGAAQVSRFPSGEVILKIQIERGDVADLEFSPDGQFLAVANHHNQYDLPVFIYSIESRKPVAIIKDVSATNIAWSPGGNQLLCLTSKHDAYIQLWKPAQNKLVWNRRYGYSHNADVSWSPDGKKFAVCDRDVVAVHSAATGEVVTRMSDPEGAGYCIKFSPDGSRVVTGGRDGSLKMWNALSGEKTLDIAVSSSKAIHFAFSPDGTAIYFSDGTLDRKTDSSPISMLGAEQRAAFNSDEAEKLNGRLRRMLSPISKGYSLPDVIRQAEFLMRHHRTDEHATTLGIAYYRNADYDDAVRTLSIHDRHDYRGLGYLAMSHYQLNHHSEARRYFAHMTKALKDVRIIGVFNSDLNKSGASPQPGEFPVYDEVLELLEH